MIGVPYRCLTQVHLIIFYMICTRQVRYLPMPIDMRASSIHILAKYIIHLKQMYEFMSEMYAFTSGSFACYEIYERQMHY